MPPVTDHPLRYALSNELHARPFPTMAAPGQAVYLALKPPKDAAARDRAADRAHLIQLLDRHGAAHPSPGATHWFGPLGKHHLKWESHTEFVTYTMLIDGLPDRPFDPVAFDVFPDDWLAAAPGARMTSILIRIEPTEPAPAIIDKAHAWFVPESLALSRILDDELVVGSDFRIDSAGHMRMAVWARPGLSDRRLGRVVTRLCEIETYKSMAMLGFARARDLGPQMGAMDRQLTDLMGAMGGDTAQPDDTLHSLLETSTALEKLIAQTSFRFGATHAYEALVTQRISVLREDRFEGRQTFAEFMTRRFDPAMRTVQSTERRLQAMADRAIRAGDLLRTRVDVERSAENQALLASMDRRADLALRLQRTVEGLSVVAISYYTLQLLLYLLKPLGHEAGLSDAATAAIATPVVVLIVWALVRRVREGLER
jgi:uncharacterized membrane-anchored protein